MKPPTTQTTIRLTEEERDQIAEIAAKLSKDTKGGKITTAEAIRYCIRTAHADMTRSRKGK